MNTGEQIKQIFKEIGSESASIKTAQEIANLYLSTENHTKIEEKGLVSPTQEIPLNTLFDMEELSRWKNRNNQIYELSYYRPLHSNRKIIGAVITFLKKVVRKCLRYLFEPLVEQQNQFNGSLTASINTLYNNELVTQETLLNIKAEIVTLVKKMKEFESRNMQLSSGQQGLENQINDLLIKFSNIEKGNQDQYLSENLQEIKDQYHELKQDHALHERAINDLALKINIEKENTVNDLISKYNLEKESNELKVQNFVNSMQDDQDNMKYEQEELKSKVLAIEEKLTGKFNDINAEFERLSGAQEYSEYAVLKYIKNVRSKNESRVDDTVYVHNKDSKALNLYEKIDYVDFEHHFRGTRKSVTQKLLWYLPYFNGKQNVLDLGCGRGEFLELMRKNGIGARGVDTYEDFVDYCRFRGLDVIQEDAIEYMGKIPDETLDGIYMGQLVEHLATEQLLFLCSSAYKKLQKNGICVIETPNPTCLSIYTQSFYIDPSHYKPVHPKTLEYLLKKAGFRHVSVIYTEESKTPYKLPSLIGSEISNLQEFNDGINLLSDILFGSQDYAVIATK